MEDQIARAREEDQRIELELLDGAHRLLGPSSLCHRRPGPQALFPEEEATRDLKRISRVTRRVPGDFGQVLDDLDAREALQDRRRPDHSLQKRLPPPSTIRSQSMTRESTQKGRPVGQREQGDPADLHAGELSGSSEERTTPCACRAVGARSG